MSTRNPAAALVAAGIMTASAAGCSGGHVASTRTAPPVSTLRIGLMEWRIVTATAALTPGVDHLTVTNVGTTEHNLYVSGPGVQAHTPNLPPGHTATLTLDARAGSRLTLKCELPGHEEAGMHTTLRVPR